MKTVVGVKFKKTNKTYYFNPGALEIEKGMGVIVETARGTEYGEVTMGRTEVEDAQITAPLKNVLRIATQEDLAQIQANAQKEQRAISTLESKIVEHGLDMKVVDVEYSFDGSKITFYFTSDGRVDFRDLVKDLAHHFRARIELRQIGVRDEAKMLGGLGRCGCQICCKRFLSEFSPVSIKMAKEQNISLNPTKISGLCGRLMCCLGYEQAYYEEANKEVPKNNAQIQTPDGTGVVVERNLLTKSVKVRLTQNDLVEFRTYTMDELSGKTPVHREKEADFYSNFRVELSSEAKKKIGAGTAQEGDRPSRKRRPKKEHSKEQREHAPEGARAETKKGSKQSAKKNRPAKDVPNQSQDAKEKAAQPAPGQGKSQSAKRRRRRRNAARAAGNSPLPNSDKVDTMNKEA